MMITAHSNKYNYVRGVVVLETKVPEDAAKKMDTGGRLLHILPLYIVNMAINMFHLIFPFDSGCNMNGSFVVNGFAMFTTDFLLTVVISLTLLLWKLKLYDPVLDSP